MVGTGAVRDWGGVGVFMKGMPTHGSESELARLDLEALDKLKIVFHIAGRHLINRFVLRAVEECDLQTCA